MERKRYNLVAGYYSAVKLGVVDIERAFDNMRSDSEEYNNIIVKEQYEILAEDCVLPDNQGWKENNTIIFNIRTQDILFVKKEHLIGEGEDMKHKEHKCHEHCIHLCKDCYVVYCCKCGEEWEKRVTSWTSTYRSLTDGGTTITMTGTAVSNCKHEHKK